MFMFVSGVVAIATLSKRQMPAGNFNRVQ